MTNEQRNTHRKIQKQALSFSMSVQMRNEVMRGPKKAGKVPRKGAGKALRSSEAQPLDRGLMSLLLLCYAYTTGNVLPLVCSSPTWVCVRVWVPQECAAARLFVRERISGRTKNTEGGTEMKRVTLDG